eukprot:6180774-Alexandrium_andersonii.AAC.1
MLPGLLVCLEALRCALAGDWPRAAFAALHRRLARRRLPGPAATRGPRDPSVASLGDMFGAERTRVGPAGGGSDTERAPLMGSSGGLAQT